MTLHDLTGLVVITASKYHPTILLSVRSHTVSTYDNFTVMHDDTEEKFSGFMG